jgi:hypothetical protein
MQHPLSSVSHGSPSYMQRKQLFAVSRPHLNAYGWAWTQLSTYTSCVSSDVLYNLSKSAVCINWRASGGNGDYNLNHRGYIKNTECFPIKPVYTGLIPTLPPNEYKNCNMVLRWTELSRFNCLVLPYRKTLQMKILEHALHMYACARAHTHTHTHTYIYITHRYSDSLRAGQSGVQIPSAERFSAPVQTGYGAHQASCTVGTGSFSRV